MNLVDVVVWMDEDEIWLDWSSAVTVENFKKYRSDVLAVDRPYVNAQLVTSKPFTDAIGVCVFFFLDERQKSSHSFLLIV